MTTNRKPPPNWHAKWQVAQAEIEALRVQHSAIEHELAERTQSVNIMAKRERLYRDILEADRRALNAYEARRWWKPSTRVALDRAMHERRAAFDALHDFDMRHARQQPGNIQGLASRP